ncbi:hypothetical protein C8R45DRAFT_947573 [Mycena sanguinolenta]|nr:hypothetical protein C8R45DRAFT_947573 [Mycena sanguinolenta]
MPVLFIAKTCTSKMEYAPLSSPPLHDSVPIQNWLSGSLFEAFHPIADWLTSYLVISHIDGLDINKLAISFSHGQKQNAWKFTGGPAAKLDLTAKLPDSLKVAPPSKKARTVLKYLNLKASGNSNNYNGVRVVRAEGISFNVTFVLATSVINVLSSWLIPTSCFLCPKCWVSNTEGIPVENLSVASLLLTKGVLCLAYNLVIRHHLVCYYQEDPNQLKLIDLGFNLSKGKKLTQYHKNIQYIITNLETRKLAMHALAIFDLE